MLKNIYILLIITIFNNQLFANEIKDFSNTLWQRTFQNTCVESFTFNPNSNIFTFSAHSGKILMGYYTLKKVRNSKRFKVTFQITLDNGLPECNSVNYNATNQTIENYIWIENNGNTLNISEKKRSSNYNSYSNKETFTTEYLGLLQLSIVKQALNDIQQSQRNLTNQSFQQLMANIKEYQRRENDATNQKILKFIKENEERLQRKGEAPKNSNKSWRDDLPVEQLIEIQKYENKLAEKKRIQDYENRLQETYRAEERQNEYIQESYRSEEIHNDYLQESYIQEQINHDYYNNY